MSILWKDVYEYRHREENELVVLKRHRLTESIRRVWYRTHPGYFD